MKRILMQVYVKDSNKAVELYIKAFDAVLGYNVQSDDGTYYHCEIDIEGNILAVSEASMSNTSMVKGNNMQFCLHYNEGEEEKIKRAYNILKEDSIVTMPLGPCDFSHLCTDLTDKFGVRWCLFI